MKYFISLSALVAIVLAQQLLLVTPNEEEARKIRKRPLPRIINGEDARKTRFPYFTFLSMLLRNGIDSSVCGAALVWEDVVLTAAHCLLPDYREITVIVNATQNPFTMGFTGNEQIFTADESDVFIHETFRVTEFNTLFDDVAAVKLGGAVEGIEPIRRNRNVNVPGDNQQSVNMGIGRLQSNAGLANDLQEVAITVFSEAACLNTFREIGDDYDVDTMICAGGPFDGNAGSCPGDSGGPLILEGADPTADVMIGLVSFGQNPCGSLASVYGRISGFNNWIDRAICSLSDNPPNNCGSLPVPTEPTGPDPTGPEPTPAPQVVFTPFPVPNPTPPQQFTSPPFPDFTPFPVQQFTPAPFPDFTPFPVQQFTPAPFTNDFPSNFGTFPPFSFGTFPPFTVGTLPPFSTASIPTKPSPTNTPVKPPSEQPTAKATPPPPSPSPVTTPPTKQPVTDPTEAPMEPLPSSGGLCFSGNTRVETKERGSVFMKDLQVGDLVLSRSGRFEKVYSFGHLSHTTAGRFIRLLPTGLELSKEHMVFIQGRGAIPAGMVQIGDRFENGDEVSEIQAITQGGLYAPFTTSGTITVNNVAASCYISFQDSNVLVLGSWRTPITYQWLAHFFLTPHRIWYIHFGMEDSGGLVDSGMSGWAQQGYTMAHWLLDQSQIVTSLILCVLAFAMLPFSTVEFLLWNPSLAVLVVLVFVISTRWPRRAAALPGKCVHVQRCAFWQY